MSQERTKKRKAEEKAAAAVAAARHECGGGAGPDPLMGGRFNENHRPCSSPGDAGKTLTQSLGDTYNHLRHQHTLVVLPVSSSACL